jgi:hypothetical protein
MVRNQRFLRAVSNIFQLLSIELAQARSECLSCCEMRPLALRAMLVSPPQGEGSLAASPSQYDVLPPAADLVQTISGDCTCDFCAVPGARKNICACFAPCSSDQFQDHCQVAYIYFQ